ncbi:hypothetical protein E4U52_005600 [Claviceps spartinae]|nr:hypothetical protein E4U52_005600 [Claviceps spartinae]
MSSHLTPTNVRTANWNPQEVQPTSQGSQARKHQFRDLDCPVNILYHKVMAEDIVDTAKQLARQFTEKEDVGTVN